MLLTQSFAHLYWADLKLLEALPEQVYKESAVHKEFAHIIGAEEIWLSRIEKRDAKCPVWPDFDSSTKDLMNQTHNGYRDLLASIDPVDLSQEITYTNSAGTSFNSVLSDILFHVCLHSQYHRGKVNQILRNHGYNPAPVDYIGFVRGVPAATKQ